MLFWDTILIVLLVACVLPCRGQYNIYSMPSPDDQYTFPKAGVYKYVVHVSSKAAICTGTVINNDWILSAAHCFYFRGKPINQKDARILAGIINYEQPNAQTKHDTMSSEIHIHPSFGEMKPSKYDVALVKLRDSLEFGPYIDKIRVAADGWPQDEPEECFALGFGGYLSTAPATADLKRWSAVNASHGENACPCARSFQWKRMVCDKEMSPRMCKSDDGGPLVCNDTVRAIGHMVWDRASCSDAIYPTVKCVGGPEKVLSLYMFLCPVNDWMHSIVSDIPPKPESCRAPSLTFTQSQVFLDSTLVLLLLWFSVG